ncbi:protein-L-isoaspartate O-methyltransferase family protein [Corticibacter populi]|uniref:protein-L-isoaspartate(D-aspartate) O-methyltransferase n=1 Tax=Corticibacter populi TaxID=1550736 RepID=UPI0010F181AD|nr:protein-L-isoaspartate(D-aspartate) O-methyltransferase [Corticibacter populi]
MTERKPRFPAQVLPAATLRAQAVPERRGAAPVAAAASLAAGGAGAALRRPAAAQLSPATLTAAAFSVSSQEGARTRMVSRLAAAGNLRTPVLEAMRAVPRHAFIDSALIAKAYEDNSLPIGFGQTISKPMVVARMLSLLLEAGTAAGGGIAGRVLEIGTGCGYQAALLSRIAAEVYSIERVKGLHERARDNLRPLRVANLHLLFGDGMQGYARGAPYAAIISAAGGEDIPQTWIDQLAVGGRIIAPTHADKGGQVLVVVDKTRTGIKRFALESVHFVPLKSGVD